MKKIHFSSGAHAAGSPFEQGRAAAGAALEQAGRLPPALALITGRGCRNPDEILRGAREVLGDCPLVGLVCAAAGSGGRAARAAEVRVLLLSSAHLKAKVGIGEAGEGGWEQQAREAFRDSFIPATVPHQPDDAAESSLYRWYLYRRPSLALAAVLSPPGEQRSRETRVASFLKRRLHGRVPLLLLTPPPDGSETVLLAGGRVVRSGVVLTMIKTDLKFSLERFHSFEPVGVKLIVTRFEGERIFECNGRPALEAYREALGFDPAAAVGAGAGLEAFDCFPLAHRGRDGSFTLLLPEEIGADGSLSFATPVEPDRLLYLMKAVSAPDLWSASPRHGAFLSNPHRLAAVVILRDPGLVDLPEVLPVPEGAGEAMRPVDIPCGRGLKAYLSPGDTGGEGGHLLLAVERELDPFAVAAVENERLLGEVMQLKDLHQKIFDSIGYGIAVIDASRRILFCNNTYRILLTGSPEELEGRVCPWSSDGTAVCGTCAGEEAITQATSVTREVVRLAEGKTHWCRLDTFPLRDATGKVTSAIEVMRDITAFKDLRFSLESEQRKMEAVIRGMGETLYIVNSRYDLQFFHRGTFPATPGFGGEAADRKCYQALFQRNLPCPWCGVQEILLSGGVTRQVAHVPGEAGEDRSYQVTFSPWGSERGDQASVVCLLVDISVQKQLEQQMVLSEKLNSLSILSAGMAHELNNPLGAINFNLEILKRRERDGEYREVLESIRKDVLRINRIVGNLLSFSRSAVASSGWVALPEVVETALELFQVVIERREIEVRKSFAAGLPSVWGNAQDLQQVFINLIANSVDAMPSGGAIEIVMESAANGAAESEPTGIAVVYDNAGDLALLRTFIDVPDWDVRFFRGDGEAIDSFRQSPATPPEVLLLDFTATKPERVDFFVMMVREYAPEARILVVESGQDDQRWARIPGVAGVLPRPLDATLLLERVRTLIASLRAQRRASPEVIVRFGDTGVGIPPEIQERIFDPFFTTKEAKGTGLGLSVVHKILENHGATVRVSSSPGKGTSFSLKFPQTQTAGPGGHFRLRPEHGLGLGRDVG